ncbi:GTPase IMAP family member 4-like isoform X2 [Amphiura filiformis]|uniref:GTPase IMAP family member 4-like isoform X2 n=1 Tax=Amphiura filiformis TaxID=82378 RepID=UPI003B20FDF2
MTAAGKSSLCNSILGVEEKLTAPFVSKASPAQVTTKLESKDAKVLDYRVSIVDTPGLFDTINCIAERDVLKRSISLISPGPHAILLTIKVGRFTEEVIRGIGQMRKSFGRESTRFLIVVFTHVDYLFDDDDDDSEDEEGNRHSIDERRARKLQQYVDRISGPCRNLLEDCSMRYVGVNSKFKSTSEENRQQVHQLLSMIETDGECYTLELLEKDIKGEVVVENEGYMWWWAYVTPIIRLPVEACINWWFRESPDTV